MIALLMAVFAASLVGSLHCAGMCGPFVVFYSGTDASSGWRRFLAHGAYSGGRLAAYVLLGSAAGAIGATLEVAGALGGLQHIAAIAAGIIMIGWGIVALLRVRGLALLSHSTSPRLRRWVHQGFVIVSAKPPLVRAVGVGLLSGVLPCGWLWVFLVAAAGTGSAATGALAMAAFWAGTVPILLATGLGVQLATAGMRRALPSLTAVLLVAMGLFAILSRPASVTATLPQDPPHGIKATQEHVSRLGVHETSCCEDPLHQP